MIEILAFLGLVIVLMLISYYLNYRYFGETFSLYIKDLMLFLIRDQQNKVERVFLSVFLTIRNNGLKKIVIKEINLNLLANEILIPFTIATKSHLSFSEDAPKSFPFQINKNDRYDKILSFTTSEPLGEELRSILVAKNGLETVKEGKYEIKLTVKYGTRKKQKCVLKLNLNERNIANLPEIDGNRVILPIEMYMSQWVLNSIQKGDRSSFRGIIRN